VLAGPTPATAQGSWIDVHMHVVGGPRGDFGGAVETAIKTMDRAGTVIAVAMPTPQAGGSDRPAPWDYDNFADLLRRTPGRFAFAGGGGTLNPMIHRHPHPSDVTPDLRRAFERKAEAIAAAGAVGFGEMSALHLSLEESHPFESVQPDHPLFLLLADIAARHRMIIDLHMDAVAGAMRLPDWLKGTGNPPVLDDNVAGLERLLAHNPAAIIVWAHGGSDMLGNLTPALIRRLMQAHPNLYMSLRPVPPQADRLNKILVSPVEIDKDWRALLVDFADRFMIGTDSFMVSPQMMRGPPVAFSRGNQARQHAVRMVLAALPADVARRIGNDNARRLYRLAQ
jgi:hypothetical protein